MHHGVNRMSPDNTGQNRSGREADTSERARQAIPMGDPQVRATNSFATTLPTSFVARMMDGSSYGSIFASSSW